MHPPATSYPYQGLPRSASLELTPVEIIMLFNCYSIFPALLRRTVMVSQYCKNKKLYYQKKTLKPAVFDNYENVILNMVLAEAMWLRGVVTHRH
ncbi:MAG: hypothetical protein ABI416_14160 [Ginsengibacter sp.]